MPKKNTTPGHLYDDIKTAKELVQEVMAHGLSTDVNDICRAQDIFGHSAVGDLVVLANDDAQAANKRGVNQSYQSTFYSIIFHIWNWEQAVNFYNQYTNTVMRHLKKLVGDYRTEAQELEKQKALLKTDTEQMHTQIIELEQRAGGAETKLAAAEQTILELKAQLWDLTMGGEK